MGEGSPQVPDTCPGPASRFHSALAQPLFHTLPSSLDFLTPFLGQLYPPLGSWILTWDACVGFVANQMDKG